MKPSEAAAVSHVAFLRGINVGGKHLVPMARLVALFEAASCQQVRTHLASGNVLFAATPSLARALPQRLAAAIGAEFGFEVPVVVRSVEELENALAAGTFVASGADPSKLHIAFLAKKPTPAQVAALDPARSPPDAFEVHGREVHLHCPDGLARTRLTNAYLDRTLGTVSTLRTRKTVQRLVVLARA